MCDYEEFIWSCEHSDFRLKSYCHKARNNPGHACNFVKRLRHCWDQGRPCDACLAKQAAEAHAQMMSGWYGSNQASHWSFAADHPSATVASF
ncbi:hypothetical protein QC761_201520 [Podospora bellae-mahoneyi]|uniref:TAZ-type domain-containing protein n=1 Tax=Podospora bellae-mahoneyi TaxID=2093777 RepID=A0ABR0FND8_9PEZI|nr:hypothetical protein QC761_201520 [Podospora bellae-mahoneyi]